MPVMRPSLVTPRAFSISPSPSLGTVFLLWNDGAVVLFMVNQLLLPGHVERIAGFSGFRAALESLVGPLSTQALASQIFGLYSGLVYFTPLLGGMIADRWIGQRNAVVVGALSMSAGHIAMAFVIYFSWRCSTRYRIRFFER